MARTHTVALLAALLLTSSLVAVAAQVGGKEFDEQAAALAKRYLEQGKQIFRFDTFGSEDFWGGKLKLHEVIAGEKLRGKGPGLSPEQALKLGLKVDIDTKDVAEALNKGNVDISDPASTLLLLKAKAVVGLTGFFRRMARSSSLLVFNAPYAIQQLTIPMLRESGSVSMDGQIAIWMLDRSSPSL
jgi:hypothetical protein